MAFKLVLLAVVIVVHACMANVEACNECDDVTELCVKQGESTGCRCRPSLFRDAETDLCKATKSYTTTADFVNPQWEEIPEGSEEYINLSNEVCDDFNNTLAKSVQFETFYYGCDVVAFTESDDGVTHGVVVLSLFKVTLNDSYVDELNSVLSTGLSSHTYVTATIDTTATNECELNIQDCDVLADCRDTGSVGFTCSCIDSTDDESPEGLPGRDCAIRTHMYIVGISVGAGLVFFLILVSIVACVSTHTTLGKTPSEVDEERKAKSGKKPSDTDETPLDPRGDGGGREGVEDEGVTNGGFEEAQVPKTIFDVDDDQMARLAQIHLAIERNSRPASGVPVARENNQMRLSRLPSTDYGPERQNAALYQNGANRKPRNERTSLVRLPSGEYLTPMSPREMSPPPPQNPYGVRNKQRPQSAAYTDEMNNQIYASRLPSTKYDQRTAASPPPTPAPEPYLSRQSSSVFLPNSPRNSRQYGGGSNYSYNGRY